VLLETQREFRIVADVVAAAPPAVDQPPKRNRRRHRHARVSENDARRIRPPSRAIAAASSPASRNCLASPQPTGHRHVTVAGSPTRAAERTRITRRCRQTYIDENRRSAAQARGRASCSSSGGFEHRGHAEVDVDEALPLASDAGAVTRGDEEGIVAQPDLQPICGVLQPLSSRQHLLQLHRSIGVAVCQSCRKHVVALVAVVADAVVAEAACCDGETDVSQHRILPLNAHTIASRRRSAIS